ncbi:MAG: type III secretion system outer membrane ring subunit SctC [Chitinophagaceae bacterium]
MGKNLRPLYLLGNLFLVFAILLANIQPVSAVTPPFWKDTGYIYSANQTPIKKLLEDFCNQFGIVLNIHPSIKGTINGRIASNNAIEFLDRLALMRKFRWFVYSNTLYVVPLSDNAVEKMKIASESASEAKQAIIGIGLFEPRFGWGELTEEQAVIISGPSEYVKLVKKVLGKDEAKRNDSEIMLFKLKYANADDREIQYRNRIIITPGVATILRNLLQDKRARQPNMDLAATARNTYGGFAGNAMSQGGLSPNPMGNTWNGGNTVTANTAAGQGARPPLSPFSFLSGGNGAEASVSLDQSLSNSAQQNYLSGFNASGSSSKENKYRVPLVEADSRLNAVIIRDDPSKREYYQALINEFDQQPKMVEIEAMIIDINRSRMKDLGIDWTLRAGKTTAGFSAVATSSLGLDGAASAALGAGSSILVNNLGNLYARIRALEQDGEAYILAKPSVLTVDNLGAVLDLNRTAYIRLVGERVADVMPVTAGTMLKVTPRVINDGGGQRIHLVVDIEDGEVQEKEGSSTPSVQRSTISTQAIIEENQALVIGGYQSQNDARTKQRIPVLGDIPVLGGLFTRTENSNSNKERIFVIVPRAMVRNYKRTYGNNVEGTPLPPTIGIPQTLPNSANGLGQIVYNAAHNNTIDNINKTNSITPPTNPFIHNANIAPPAAATINNPSTDNLNTSKVNKNNIQQNNPAAAIRDVSYLLNQKNTGSPTAVQNLNPNNKNTKQPQAVNYNANHVPTNNLQLSTQLSNIPPQTKNNKNDTLNER